MRGIAVLSLAVPLIAALPRDDAASRHDGHHERRWRPTQAEMDGSAWDGPANEMDGSKWDADYWVPAKAEADGSKWDPSPDEMDGSKWDVDNWVPTKAEADGSKWDPSPDEMDGSKWDKEMAGAGRGRRPTRPGPPSSPPPPPPSPPSPPPSPPRRVPAYTPPVSPPGQVGADDSRNHQGEAPVGTDDDRNHQGEAPVGTDDDRIHQGEAPAGTGDNLDPPGPSSPPSPAPGPGNAPASAPAPAATPGSPDAGSGPAAGADHPALVRTNEYRQRHNSDKNKVGPLRWDPELARAAQAWADNCEFRHGGYGNAGQNLGLAWATYPPSMDDAAWTTTVDAWYGEEGLYRDWMGYGEPTLEQLQAAMQFGRMIGHFTQTVWAGTTALGCGRARCSPATKAAPGHHSVLTVCHYGPAGNVVGSYRANVFPPS